MSIAKRRWGETQSAHADLAQLSQALPRGIVPPLGLGLYGSCLIGGVRLEETVKPIMKYLGVLFLCLLVIAFVPSITTALPRTLNRTVDR